MPVYMLHRILRDVLMFAGIYDYLGEMGWLALVVLCALSFCMVYLLASDRVAKRVSAVLALHV